MGQNIPERLKETAGQSFSHLYWTRRLPAVYERTWFHAVLNCVPKNSLLNFQDFSSLLFLWSFAAKILQAYFTLPIPSARSAHFDRLRLFTLIIPGDNKKLSSSLYVNKIIYVIELEWINTYVNKHKFAPLHHKYHVKKAYCLVKVERAMHL